MTVDVAPQATKHRLTDRGGQPYEFVGEHLGHGSSAADGKTRWFEVNVYVRKDNDAYVVETLGRSSIPGETTYVRIIETTSAFEIIELLTVNHNGKIYLPRQSARALAQAAQWDDDIRDAYINRAVI